MRVLAATALVCGLASQAWAQATTAALPAIPDLAPLSVPVDSAATHRSWASGRGIYAFFASDGARAVLRRAGLSVGDDGLYVWVSANRIWDAVDDATRTQIKARIAAAAGELGRRLDAQGSELGLQVAHLREQVGQLREGLPEGLREAIAGARSLAAAAASGVR